MKLEHKEYLGKRTSEEWQKLHLQPVVMDPDGWDRTNWKFSWFEELIEFDEYQQRVVESTCLYTCKK